MDWNNTNEETYSGIINFIFNVRLFYQKSKIVIWKKMRSKQRQDHLLYIWLYDKKTGLPATKDQCVALDEEK